MTPEEWRAKLEALPMPMEGPGPWEGVDPFTHKTGDDAYQLASELTAKALLICADEDPSLLDIPDTMTDTFDRATYSPAWEAAKERWPGLDDWLGGISLNMFGWANGLVRWIHGKEPVGNPALWTVRIG